MPIFSAKDTNSTFLLVVHQTALQNNVLQTDNYNGEIGLLFHTQDDMGYFANCVVCNQTIYMYKHDKYHV